MQRMSRYVGHRLQAHPDALQKENSFCHLPIRRHVDWQRKRVAERSTDNTLHH